jgi:Zn-dependent peptidase ImmA (M78 family)/transcriptional regulator with XRE-family HTH domain
MSEANPEMIVLARESRAVSQRDLAEKLGITQAALSKIEAGIIGVSDVLLRKFSEALHYPPTFFFQQELRLGLGPSELYHYRKRAKLSKKVLDAFHAQLTIRRMQLRGLLASVDIEAHAPFPRLDVDEFGDPAEVARALRAMWHVARGPMRSITKVIEDAGGIVVHFRFGSELIDAISRNVPGVPPLFFMNPDVGGARYRYTLAHELGHMVMHAVPNPKMEDEANEFAAEFLMPADDIRPMLTGLSVAKLASLTPYWRVSMAAILKRAADLKKLSVRAERSLWIAMAAAGYTKKEPVELDFPVEEPSLLSAIIDTHVSRLGYDAEQLAQVVHLFADELAATYPLGQRGFRVVKGSKTIA